MKVHGFTKYFAALTLLLATCPIQGQDKVKKQAKAELVASMTKSEPVDAEFEVKMLEMELKLAHLAAQQVRVEQRKVAHQVKALETEGHSPREREAAQLQLEQVDLEVQSHEVQVEMARLRLEHARSYLQARAKPASKKAAVEDEHPVPVKIEVDDDTGVVIIRGPKASVEKVKALIEKIQQPDKK